MAAVFRSSRQERTGKVCSDSLSRCFNDMPENDKQEFLPTAEEEK